MTAYADTLRELTGCDPYEDHAFHHSISLTCDLCMHHHRRDVPGRHGRLHGAADVLGVLPAGGGVMTHSTEEARRQDIAAALAEHYPTYTEYANDPTRTFYCVPCSEAGGEWVTADADHLADVVMDTLAFPSRPAAQSEGSGDDAR